MRSTLVRNFVRPLLERLGTMLAAYLIAKSIDSDLAAQAANGVVALCAIGVDLILARMTRDKVAAAAALETQQELHSWMAYNSPSNREGA